MPLWLRVILIVVVVFVLGIVAIGAIVYRAYKARGPELRAAARAMRREGEAFGAGKRGDDCVEESLRRAREDRSFTGAVTVRMFADSCLKAAAPEPSFCEKVPTGVINMARWANAECAAHGMQGQQGCTQVFTAVSDYCSAHR